MLPECPLRILHDEKDQFSARRLPELALGEEAIYLE